MKSNDVTMSPRFEKWAPLLAEIGRFELDDLEDAIYVRRLHLYAEWLRAKGFTVTEKLHNDTLRYLLIHNPSGEAPAAWADMADCQRLLDTVANLPPAEAFTRCVPKFSEFEVEEYTEDDAKRDTRAARAELKADFEGGKFTSSEYSDLYKSTSFMDLAPRRSK